MICLFLFDLCHLVQKFSWSDQFRFEQYEFTKLFALLMYSVYGRSSTVTKQGDSTYIIDGKCKIFTESIKG